MEKQPEQTLKRYVDFFRTLGLPTTCAEMGIELQDNTQLLAIARQSMVKGDSNEANADGDN
ncbi:hypothetical protein [uncultured Enterococcus sp.]|uniref:hypothetical protein n=1 Tax=uncultured Enterococcus sp. TaxID=167972 RepID=UPI002AA7AE23|nr:hypothetical protein [uncultured Enterococcus sp.]